MSDYLDGTIASDSIINNEWNVKGEGQNANLESFPFMSAIFFFFFLISKHQTFRRENRATVDLIAFFIKKMADFSLVPNLDFIWS
jgi:hypothetical protein